MTQENNSSCAGQSAHDHHAVHGDQYHLLVVYTVCNVGLVLLAPLPRPDVYDVVFYDGIQNLWTSPKSFHIFVSFSCMVCCRLAKNCKKRRVISASTDGGPRYRVCAR